MNNISIILPIYNVEKYLPQCLESVINQTYKKLEIILVNDGSTDSCPQICDDYLTKDKRIKVIHQENGGLSAARNAGLMIATGAFISFVDSDDLLSLDFYKILLNALLENNVDIVECGFLEFKKDIDIKKFSPTVNENSKIFETEAALQLLMNERLKQIVWNKLYRKEVILDLQFPIGKINEDEFWTYKVFGNSKKIVQIPDVLYFYRQQEESIMGKKYSLNRLDGLQGLEERIGYMKEKFPNLENSAINIFCFGAMAHYQKINDHSEIDPQNSYRKNIVENVKKYNQNSIIRKWDWKAIFWFQLFILAPNIFVKLRNLNETRVKMVQQKQL